MAARPLWLRTTIDSLHALSAGATPGAAIALWVVRLGAQAKLDEATLATLVDTWTPILWVPVVAVALLIATGLIRLPHRSAHVSPEAVRPRGRATIAKHVVFVTLLVGAIALMIAAMQ